MQDAKTGKAGKGFKLSMDKNLHEPMCLKPVYCSTVTWSSRISSIKVATLFGNLMQSAHDGLRSCRHDVVVLRSCACHLCHLLSQ